MTAKSNPSPLGLGPRNPTTEAVGPLRSASPIGSEWCAIPPKMIHEKLQLCFPETGGVNLLQGSRYCGPSHGYVRQDVLSGRIGTLPMPTSLTDAICKIHDQCFADKGYFALECDIELIASLLLAKKISSSMSERTSASYMIAYFALQLMTIDMPVGVYRATRDAINRFFTAVNREIQNFFGIPYLYGVYYVNGIPYPYGIHY